MMRPAASWLEPISTAPVLRRLAIDSLLNSVSRNLALANGPVEPGGGVRPTFSATVTKHPDAPNFKELEVTLSKNLSVSSSRLDSGGSVSASAAGASLRFVSSHKFRVTGLPTAGAGKVTITATVPAKAMGKKGKPIKVATGSANATGTGNVTVKLKLTSAAKKRLKKLKGTKLTLKITQNGRATAKTVKVG